jgi:alpha-ketoglutarate-dependent taurine dioxygenase
MKNKKLRIESLDIARRREIKLSEEGLVRGATFEAGSTLPFVLQPTVEGVDLPVWAGANRDFINALLRKHGGLLFRNFNVKSVNQFEQFIKSICGELLTYYERSSPRSSVSDAIYTSTDYPSEESIFLHNENSYQQTFPLKIFFNCAIQPEGGGETPIADCRKVYQRISPKIREQFVQKLWMYVRNFGNGYGLDWQTVFQTSDKRIVEEYCHNNGIKVEWKTGNRLKTYAVRPAVSKHPLTGEMVWFNHATFFHVSTLDSKVRELIMNDFKEEDLPANTYYGDGSRIGPDVLDHLRAAYCEETVVFPWRQGDILMLDNMLVAHGRRPFTGQRKILVGMSELFRHAE